MLRVIAIGILLLYYWYYCKFETTPVSQPTTPPPPPFPTPPLYALESVDSLFVFYVGDDPRWEASIPDGYRIDDERFMVKDACYEQPDGTRVLATGLKLYKHLRVDTPLTVDSFEPHASFPMQQGHVFYFECLDNTISGVHMCPPGNVFSLGACRPIDVCTGKTPGLLLPNAYDHTSYYECIPTGEAILRECPDQHYFLHDSCHSTQNLVDYCRFNDDPRILNDVTVVRCHQKTPAFETCPPGTMLFGTLQCQSTACVGKPNGTRLPMPLHTEGPFQYSPGYLECQNERVSDVSHLCPSTWDPHLSLGDNLTHLPQVFDGHACAVPNFCTNVTSDDPHVVVPVHEFTKHVRNWKHSEAFDAVTGYRCDTNTRMAVPAGQRINKKFRLESACTSDTDKVIISGEPEHYFDCTTQSGESCPPNQFFDGDACRDRTAFAHTYNGLDLFVFNGLSHDGWMSSFNYERVGTQKTCTGSESELLSIYNVCSHPECTLYPFLAQVDFSIKLSNQHECVFDGDKIVKRPTAATFHYATQRERMAWESADDPCIVGNRVRSGHFVIDSSLYTTCDAQQPFVFCPSPHTTGIEAVNVGNRFACVLNDRMTGRLPPKKRIKFQKNELDAVVALPDTSPLVRVNSGAFQPVDHVPTREALFLESTEMVQLDYHTRVSYPPDIAFTKQGGVSKSFPGQAFFMPTQKHTAKPVTLPKHDVVACVKDFS